ncbi:MAG: peptidoglycan-binding protein [Propionibacteriaceae bacterium]
MAFHRLTPARLLLGAALSALLVSTACTAPSTQPAPEVSPSAASSTAATPPTTAPSPSAPPTPKSTPTAKPSATPKPAPEPTETKPVALLSKGDKGDKVRDLQHRLRQLEWFAGNITGTYGKATVTAVAGFQEKRNYDDTGEVDQKTWDKLTSMTKKPSHDDMYNILRPGPAILKKGSEGDKVRDLQARLKQIAWYSGKVTGTYGSVTVKSVKGFQEKRAIPVTGEVDRRTLNRLDAMTRTPSHNEKHNIIPKPSAAGLDSRCMTGRAMCVSKRTNKLVWVIDGKPQLRTDVRFGSQELPTRNGAFRVGWKSRNHVSSIYKTPMPYAMFFSGGQAVHYSPDFAARGYAGASHGCVNVRNRAAIQRLFNNVRVGDKVIVYS